MENEKTVVLFFFFPARSFSSVGRLACEGGAREIVSPSFCFHFFFSPTIFFVLVCVFSLIASFRFNIS